jgi:predicted XRE-type DNA-binding protein
VITIVTDPEIDHRAELVRRRTTEAAQAQAEAAKAARELAGDLRRQGLSVSDIAEVMGVTRGRVSQLLRPTGSETQPQTRKRVPA